MTRDYNYCRVTSSAISGKIILELQNGNDAEVIECMISPLQARRVAYEILAEIAGMEEYKEWRDKA